MRPSKRFIFGQNNHVNSCRVDMFPNGVLKWVGGTKDHGWISLSGVIYSPTQAGTEIPLNISHWAPYGGEYGAPSWVKEGNIVVLSGLARISTAWATVNQGDSWNENNLGGRLIGQLPEGARPTKRLVFNCDNHGKANRVDVLPNGKIVLTSTGSGEAWMSLNNIAFSTVEGAPLQLLNNWAVYHSDWAVPSAIKHGNICMLQGLIKPPTATPGSWNKVAQLPKEMWPARQLIFNGMGANQTARLDVTTDGGVWWGVGLDTIDWVSLSNIVYAVPEQQLGGKNYTHVERLASYRAYHENWKFGMPGQGWIKFKARGVQDITLFFSSLPQELPGAMYCVFIGGYDNTRSYIRKEWGGANLYEIDTLKGGNPQAIVTGGRPGNGMQWDDYWIKIDNGLVTFGKGVNVDQNEIGRWQDPNPLKFVQYIGFGGWDVAVDYKDIQISGAPVVELPINLPVGFNAEEGKVKRITVGSRNGELEVWAVAFDEQLYRYDPYSMAPLPWVKQEFKNAAGALMKFEDISCASDGTLVAIGEQGKALRYDWDKKAWNPIDPGKGNEAIDLEFISAGNKDCIWAVDTDDKDICELTKEGWKVRADGVGAYVAAGVDRTIVGLNAKGEAFRYDGGRWFEMPGVLLERVAVGDKDNIIGSTDKDNALWQWKDNKWQPMLGGDGKPATGLDEIAVNAAGTIFGADEDGDVYHKGDAGVALAKPAPAAVKALTDQATKAVADLAAGKPVAPLSAEVKDVVAKVAPDLLTAKPGKKPAAKAPSPEQIKKAAEAKLTKAKPAAPKKAATRAKAKKEGKVKAKPIKKKTTGKGKALKKGAKVKKAVKKAEKLVKKAKKKAEKKKKAAEKAAKKPEKKAAKKSAKKPEKKPAKKPAKK
jgi:hypothetical protein